MTIRMPRMRATGLALAASLAFLASEPAGAAPKGVDPKASSIVAGDAAALGFDPAKLAAAREALKADVASGKIAGAYLLVGRHGKVAFQEGFGTQGPGQATPVTDETIFRIFSMTKPLVSVVAMTLVEDGKLDVDAPVSKYLPEYAGLKVWQADGTTVPATQPMLVRHLMSHTSGLIYGFGQEVGLDPNTAPEFEQAQYERTADDPLRVRFPAKAGERLVQVAFLEENHAWEAQIPPRETEKPVWVEMVVAVKVTARRSSMNACLLFQPCASHHSTTAAIMTSPRPTSRAPGSL